MTRRIALDVDGVLANFVQMAVDWTNRIQSMNGGPPVYYDEVKGWNIFEQWKLPELAADFDAYVNAERPCRYLELYPGAKQFYLELCKLGEVISVTSPYEAAATWECDRRAWLREMFGIKSKDVVFTSRKELVTADILIDDGSHNIDVFPGPAVLVERPWNKGYTPEKGYLVYRAGSLEGVLECVRTEFDRQDAAEKERRIVASMQVY